MPFLGNAWLGVSLRRLLWFPCRGSPWCNTALDFTRIQKCRFIGDKKTLKTVWKPRISLVAHKTIVFNDLILITLTWGRFFTICTFEKRKLPRCKLIRWRSRLQEGSKLLLTKQNLISFRYFELFSRGLWSIIRFSRKSMLSWRRGFFLIRNPQSTIFGIKESTIFGSCLKFMWLRCQASFEKIFSESR